jgi:hypothetical protein
MDLLLQKVNTTETDAKGDASAGTIYGLAKGAYAGAIWSITPASGRRFSCREVLLSNRLSAVTFGVFLGSFAALKAFMDGEKGSSNHIISSFVAAYIACGLVSIPRAASVHVVTLRAAQAGMAAASAEYLNTKTKDVDREDLQGIRKNYSFATSIYQTQVFSYKDAGLRLRSDY